MSKRTLQKAMALALLPLSFTAFANSVSSISTTMQLESSLETRSGVIKTQTYFYNGQWYIIATESDNLFGEKQRVVLNGEMPITTKENLEKRIKDDALLVRNHSDATEHFVSSDSEAIFSNKDGKSSLSICIKAKKTDVYNLVSAGSGSCDFTAPDESSFEEGSYNTSVLVNTLKSSMTYNEIEFIVGEHQEVPLKSLTLQNYNQVAVKGNMIFFK